MQLSKFPGQVGPEQHPGLPKYTAYARLLIDGLTSSPFSLQTLAPPTQAFGAGRAEIIRGVSRRGFATNALLAPTAQAETSVG